MRYTGVFGTMALVAAGCGILWGLLWWPLALPWVWGALSLALAAVAYAGAGASLLGKREDGSLPAWSFAINGPFLLLGLVSMRLFHAGVRGTPWHEVVPGVYLGQRPSRRRDSAAFRDTGITGIVDLCAELPATRVRTRDVAYLSLPVLDHEAPTPEQLGRAVAFIEAHRQRGPLLVHCALGRSRSATVLAAWLMASGDLRDPDAIEAMLQRSRPGVRLSPPQRRALRHWNTAMPPLPSAT